MFGCIGIVGLGLIGGSLGLELQNLGIKVCGLAHRLETVERAKQRKLVDFVSNDPAILSDCDVIILALPLEKLINPPDELITSLPEKAVVTDVGSVKIPVINTWSQLHPRFVPSHPMTGTAYSGVNSGELGLFKNRPWVVTPGINTDSEAVEIIRKIAIALGSKWIVTNPKKHDHVVALISHLPVIISAALLRTLGQEKDPNIAELSKLLASGGFADTTRIGGGNPELGRSMAAYNPKEILSALNSYKSSLEKLEELILLENWTFLLNELQQTKTIRKDFFG